MNRNVTALEHYEAAHTYRAIGLQAALCFPGGDSRQKIREEIRDERAIAKSIRRRIARLVRG